MIIHVVREGETITGIARQYGISPRRIISDNGLTAPGDLAVGQSLVILIPTVVYTVQSGDTLISIAERFGTTTLTLLQNNPTLIDEPNLFAGRQIVIQFDGEKRREIAVTGYAYPFIRRDVLNQSIAYLTYLSIFSYGFRLDGSLVTIDDQPLINLAYQYRVAPVMMLSSIDESGQFSSERASRLFNDPALQNAVLDNVLAVMNEKGYLGLEIDFEFVDAADRGVFVSFLQNARARLQENGFFLQVDLAPKTSSTQPGRLYEGQDYAAIGAAADTVLVMTYEWGYTYGPPMAVAPLNEVRRVMEYAVTQISPQQIFMGVPNYGYIWTLPFQRGISMATSIGNQYAVELAVRNRAEIIFDELAQSPYFYYRDDNGLPREVWFEDARSIDAKLRLTDELQVNGVGYWNLMRPFRQNWALLNSLYNIRKVVV